MDEQREVMTEVLENADDAVDVIDLPPVEESSGIGTILWGAAKIAALAGGAAFAATKVSQKVYDYKCEKKGYAPQTREKFYQFWRRKAKMKTVEVDPVEGTIHEVVDPEEEN